MVGKRGCGLGDVLVEEEAMLNRRTFLKAAGLAAAAVSAPSIVGEVVRSPVASGGLFYDTDIRWMGAGDTIAWTMFGDDGKVAWASEHHLTSNGKEFKLFSSMSLSNDVTAPTLAEFSRVDVPPDGILKIRAPHDCEILIVEVYPVNGAHALLATRVKEG